MKEILLKLRLFVRKIINRYIEHDLSQLGGQVAFFAILSLLPFVIYINTLITSFNFTREDIMNLLQPTVPAYVADMISSYVSYISTQNKYGILSAGIITTIYSASKMIRSVEKSINRAYGIAQRRGFIRSVIISMVFIVCIGVIILATLYFIMIGASVAHTIFNILHLPMSILDNLKDIKWSVFVAALFFTVSALYYIMPYRKISYKSTLPGTVFSIAAFGLLSEGYTLYIKYGIGRSFIYGSLGAVFLVFVWLYIVAIVLILGAEINSALDSEKK